MGTDKMSGEVSRSRQKKAAAPPAKKAQNGTNGGSTTSKSSNWNKENKKKSKDRKNKQNMASPKKSSQSGFLCSTWTLVILLTLTGISVASYHQYPEKVQAVLDVLPPQAIVYFDTVKDTTVHYGKIVSAKSADFILDGIDMASDGYGMVHPYIQKAVDGTKDTLGPYIGPTVGPYWDAFYNHVAEMYKESNALARQWTREINLEQFLFKEEIEKERLEKAKLAAEKIKAAVEEMNKKAAEEKAKQEAEEKARKEAEEKAKKEAEEKAKKEAELKAKKEAEEKAKKEAEEKARIEAELKAKKEAEEKAK